MNSVFTCEDDITVKPENAKKINEQMREVMGKLEDSLWFAMENCTEEEYKAYKRAIGRVMGSVVIEVFNPLYEEHPELDPEKQNRKSGTDPE